jgi:hypothetical protein
VAFFSTTVNAETKTTDYSLKQETTKRLLAHSKPSDSRFIAAPKTEDGDHRISFANLPPPSAAMRLSKTNCPFEVAIVRLKREK